ncbi:MAG: hypothetical protein E7157_01755 [Lactobacillales bacterium]|nr:hypothetical protein [Lactobacillales bacterium]
MKKKKLISLVVIILLFIFTFQTNLIVKADSGFGGSYSSGGSSSSGSSISSSGGGSDELTGFEVIAVVIIMVVAAIYFKKLRDNVIKEYEEKKNKSKKLAKKINLSETQIKNEIFNIYKNIQKAWMNFDYEELRKYITDEMFNMYKAQLETLEIKNQQNIMKNFELEEFFIIDVKKNQQNIILKVIVEIECNDYIINRDTKEVVKGDNEISTTYEYEMTFIKYIKRSSLKKCPNCGAKITNNESNKCEYCNSVIISDSNNWIMSKKEVLSQY